MNWCMTLWILMATGCAAGEGFDRNAFVQERRNAIDRLKSRLTCELRAQDCSDCYDLWVSSGMVDKVWAAVYTHFNKAEMVCVWERGSPESPYSPTYHVNALIHTDSSYVLLEASVMSPDASVVMATCGLTSTQVDSILASLQGNYRVFELVPECGAEWLDHACCSFFRASFDGQINAIVMMPLIPWTSDLTTYLDSALSVPIERLK